MQGQSKSRWCVIAHRRGGREARLARGGIREHEAFLGHEMRGPAWMDIISEFADVNDFDGHMEVVMSRVGHVLVQAGHGTYMPTTLEMVSETYSNNC